MKNEKLEMQITFYDFSFFIFKFLISLTYASLNSL